jgi:hypothetical protein
VVEQRINAVERGHTTGGDVIVDLALQSHPPNVATRSAEDLAGTEGLNCAPTSRDPLGWYAVSDDTTQTDLEPRSWGAREGIGRGSEGRGTVAACLARHRRSSLPVDGPWRAPCPDRSRSRACPQGGGRLRDPLRSVSTTLPTA